MYEVKTDEALGAIHCHATYAPQDFEELRRMYAALTPGGKAKLKQGYEAIGLVLTAEKTGEIGALQELQAKAVMPEIGALLDAWDGLPNDFQQEMEEESPALVSAINRIRAGMDGEL
jgi:hypothetical protein